MNSKKTNKLVHDSWFIHSHTPIPFHLYISYYIHTIPMSFYAPQLKATLEWVANICNIVVHEIRKHLGNSCAMTRNAERVLQAMKSKESSRFKIGKKKHERLTESTNICSLHKLRQGFYCLASNSGQSKHYKFSLDSLRWWWMGRRPWQCTENNEVRVW